jgi:hypothetical protein
MVRISHTRVCLRSKESRDHPCGRVCGPNGVQQGRSAIWRDHIDQSAGVQERFDHFLPRELHGVHQRGEPVDVGRVGIRTGPQEDVHHVAVTTRRCDRQRGDPARGCATDGQTLIQQRTHASRVTRPSCMVQTLVQRTAVRSRGGTSGWTLVSTLSGT